MTTALKDCPCGALGKASKPSGVLALAQCCGRFLDHPDVPAPNAEQLMRSRYSAFVLGRADYLLASWHTSTRPATLDLEPEVRWLGLEVRRHGPAGDEAVVEFVARYRVDGKAVRLHETSRFVREAGRWFYVDGEQR